MQRQKHTRKGIELLKLLARNGYRIFDLQTVRQFAPEVGLSTKYIPQALTYLKHDGWIFTLKNGLYALDISFLGGIPIHEHEIAMFLVISAAISHFSAFQYHGLTDQLPHVVHISTLNTAKLPRLKNKTESGYLIKGVPYRFIRFGEDKFFGFCHRWEGSTKIIYTDRERTLLDGLMRPHLCGGIQEVMHAFKQNLSEINTSQLTDYAMKLDASTVKRLGWVLDHLGVSAECLNPLLNQSIKSYTKLDAHGENRGPYNRKWMIRENV